MTEPATTTTASSVLQDAQEAEAAVHRAAAKVDELDARVRAELDKEKASEGHYSVLVGGVAVPRRSRYPKTEAQMMSRTAVERQKAHALAAWLERKEEEREEWEDEGEEWTAADYEKHAKARSTMGSPVYENDHIRAVRRARAEAEAEAAAAALQEDEDEDEDDDDDDSEPDAKKRKREPKKDLLAMYGSHEKVLTHYMQLANGFVVEDHGASTDPPVQLVVPKCGVEKMKSFRARFGRHLRAIGFVPNTHEEAIKQMRLHNPEYLKIVYSWDSNVWVRFYTTDPNRAFAQRRLDPHTLLEEKPLDAIDPALLEDPLADA